MDDKTYYALVQGRFYKGDIEGKRYHWREGIPGSRQLINDIEEGKIVSFIYYLPWDGETKRGKCFYGFGIFNNKRFQEKANPDTDKIEFYCEIINYSHFSMPVTVDQSFKKRIWPGANRHAGIRRISEDIFKQIISLGENPGSLTGIANFVGENNLEDLLNERIFPNELKDFEGVKATKRAAATAVYKRSQKVIRKLKKVYRGICQITGEELLSSKAYGVDVTEAHHINYLSEGGFDGDPANILIVSPEWHRLLHKKNPKLDRSKLIFIFKDGKVLPIKFLGHLKQNGEESK